LVCFAGMGGNAERVRLDVALNSFGQKRICEDCNNGWMSRVEDSAKPILVGLLDGSLTVESLATEQRNTLALGEILRQPRRIFAALRVDLISRLLQFLLSSLSPHSLPLALYGPRCRRHSP
jgi:hypothetical protein